jgi:plasmid stabilization system protein ParE
MEVVSQNALSTPCLLRARSLTDSPERGRPATRSGFRELVVPFGRGAYVIRYRIDRTRDAVVITRLWHGREQR